MRVGNAKYSSTKTIWTDCFYIAFSLWNSTATLQRFMDDIFLRVTCIFLYVDDVLVFFEIEEFKLSFKISLDKCQFYNVNTEGLTPIAARHRKYMNPSNPLTWSHYISFWERWISTENLFHKQQIFFYYSELIKIYANAKKLVNFCQDESFLNINILTKLTVLLYCDSNATHCHLVLEHLMV